LADIIRDAQGSHADLSPPGPEISIHRAGDVVGVNEVHFDLGVSRSSFSFNVTALNAYAEGAIAGANWLAEPGRKRGRYDPSDIRT
jgi:4-hydroxy-tetrahydrodipicolinate reductase